MVALCDNQPRPATAQRVSDDLPPLLSCYVGLLGITEQLLAEDIANELLMPLAEIQAGGDLLVARRYGQSVVGTTADLLIREAASLLAAGRTDVHQSLEIALRAVATTLQAHDDPDLVRLGAAVAVAVETVTAAVAAQEHRDRDG
jgi:hypothetical protein